MDPLSLTANIIAVVSAANSIAKRFGKFPHLDSTPVQFLQLQNEISDFQAVLAILQETYTHLEYQSIAPRILSDLERILGEAKELLNCLNEMLESHSSKKLFAMWRTGRGEIKTHLEKLQRIRRDFNEILSVLTVSELPRIRVELDQIGLINDGIVSTSRSMTESLDRGLDLVQSTAQQLLTMANAARAAESTPRSNIPRYSGIVVRTSSYRQSHCQNFCMCRCHRESQFRSSKWLETFIGRLFVGYTGMPYINYTSCNEATCKKEKSRLLRVNYYFPKWFLGRMITLREYSDPLEGSSLTVRTPRVVSQNSEAMICASMGNVGRLQELFSQGLASPFDISDTKESVSLLFSAVVNSRIECCKLLLSQSRDFDYETESGTAKENALRFLLEKRTDLKTIETIRLFEPYDVADETTNWSLTPIHMIVLGLSTIDLESYLSLSSIDINSQDRFGKTALMWAARRGDQKAIETLIKFGARLDIVNSRDFTIFNECSQSSPTACLQVVLNALRKCSTYKNTEFEPKPRNLPDEYLGNYAACQNLLSRPTQFGHTPLIGAIEIRNIAAARLLVDYGADVNTGAERDPQRATPFLFAIQESSWELIELLYNAGARTDVKDLEKQGILHLAAQFCDYDAISFLTTLGIKGLNPDDRDINGYTPWQLFDEIRSSYVKEDPFTRIKSKDAFKKLVDSVSTPDPPESSGISTHIQDPEEDSPDSDLDEFFEVETSYES